MTNKKQHDTVERVPNYEDERGYLAMTMTTFRESITWRNMENVTVIFCNFAQSLYNCAIFQKVTSQIPSGIECF